jgi:hypothetical protein
MIGNHRINYNDEGPGRPANLHPAAAGQRYHETAYDGRNQSLRRCGAGSYGNRDAERQCDQRDRQPGERILPE